MRARRVVAGIAVVAAASAPMVLVHAGSAEARPRESDCSTARSQVAVDWAIYETYSGIFQVDRARGYVSDSAGAAAAMWHSVWARDSDAAREAGC